MVVVQDNKYFSQPRSKKKDELIKLLKRNHIVISWSVNQILGVDPWLACHKLDTDPLANLYGNDLVGWPWIGKRRSMRKWTVYSW